MDKDDLIQDTTPSGEIGKFCLNTRRLARLLGEERLRQVNLEHKFLFSIIKRLIQYSEIDKHDDTV